MTDQPTAPPSPLTEAAPDSLDTLFARLDSHIAARTLGLPSAQSDLAAVVAELRRQREAWARAEAGGATRATGQAPRKRATKAPPTTLEDLDLFDPTALPPTSGESTT